MSTPTAPANTNLLPRPFSLETRKYVSFVPLLIATILYFIIIVIIFSMGAFSVGLVELFVWGLLCYIPTITLWDYIQDK